MGAKEGKILGPTLGYSQEPLLPLINACEPLSSIIPDISKHASSALESTPSNPADDACLYPKHGLNVKLSNCSSPCSCHVQTNKTDNLVPAEFFPNTTKGSVHIKNLQPYTLYLFDINCSEVMATKTYATRTDVYRPSSPLNIELTLNGQRLRLKWKPPAFPQGPIDEYQVIVDGVQVKPPMKNTELSYEMNKDYVAGITHTISVKACNIDTQNRTLCSDPKDTEISYFRNKTSTSSNIAPMQSISIKQISFMIILLMKILVII
ncbi:unnamed protein product [Rotaria sordida]|uniref:Fibronectin type-III domain-containing protein n=1 Tax=Rotaria sordida TaxID=392033 RepID=A0A819QEW9_9BILA|nr:unnamed protein product [Rotaria sordida]